MKINIDKCYNCGACSSVCPSNLIDVTDRIIKIREGCTKCNFCAEACPVGAIDIEEK